MSQIEKEIILRGGQFVRREIREFELGSQEAILRKFADQAGQTVKNLSMVNGVPVHLFVSRTVRAVMIPLTQLPFKSNFHSDNQRTGLVPNLQGGWANATPGCILMNDPFPLSGSNAQHFFTAMFEPGGRPHGNYLISYFKDEIHRLPYPNVFDDCRICMGHDWEANPTGGFQTISDIAVHSYASFLATSMNADLAKTQTYELFAKDMTGQWKVKGDQIDRYLQQTGIAWLAGFTP